MVQAFQGEYTQKVDKKGRMSIPADLRRVLAAGDPNADPNLGHKVKIVYGQHLKDNVEAYSMLEYQRIVDEIYAMPRQHTAAKNRLSHLYVTQSVTLDVDKDGRIILPLKIRQKLSIDEGEIYFRGLVEKFEMWNKDVFDATVNSEIDAWLTEMGDDFDPLSLLAKD